MAKHAMHNASSSSIWLNCDLYYQFKAEAEARGEDYDSTGAAAELGTMQHKVAEEALAKLLEHPAGDTEEIVEQAALTVLTRDEIDVFQDAEETIDAVVQAVEQVAYLAKQLQAEVEIEAQVPLVHEPESIGYVDVVLLAGTTLWILDYKFGQQIIEPDAPQLKIYSASVLAFLEAKGLEFEKVVQAIVQPADAEFPLKTWETTPREVREFQGYVTHTVREQKAGRAKRGVGSVSDCGFCPFKTFKDTGEIRCAHRAHLVADMALRSSTDGTFPEEVIEEVVLAKKEITDFLSECSRIVADNPDTYPSWKRIQVSNGRAWSKATDREHITASLLAEGINPFELSTPAKLIKRCPEQAELIESLSTERGHHVRLKRINNTE